MTERAKEDRKAVSRMLRSKAEPFKRYLDKVAAGPPAPQIPEEVMRRYFHH
jgi:hypothetical protein